MLNGWRVIRLLPVLLAAAFFPFLAEAGEQSSPSRLEATLLDGTPFSLAAQRGTMTLLVLWSPDSLPSRKSLGELQRFHAASDAAKVRTVAVSTVADQERVRHYVVQQQFTFSVALLGDHDFGPVSEQRLPVLYVFDQYGVLLAQRAGLFRLRDITQGMEALTKVPSLRTSSPLPASVIVSISSAAGTH